ncbi:hypothetical protein VMCG_02462 [Cytospora schulzeri]|uniref:2EXR domain-containing protein n=1 Tax=Cytospora schulzeri TaxID=448051 RepID=A0A423X168_9PEZI|nr:hypothetical protein VMCG_02462 [Valsa malicola]
MATFNTIPPEIRQEIWKLAMLPGPSVYSFHEEDFWTWTFYEDGEGGGRNYYPTFRKLLVPKQKRPAIMRLNKESRNYALSMLQEERKGVAAGHPRQYWFDMPDRPFMSDIDVFWIDNPRDLLEYAFKDRNWTKPWRIKHLALSSKCFDDVLEDVYQDEEDTRPPPRSGWDALKRCLRFFRDLEQISVVFGPTYHRTGRDVLMYDVNAGTDGSGWQVINPDVRLEDWTAGSTEEKQADVDSLVDRARTEVVEVLQEVARKRERMKPYEGMEQDGWSPWTYSASDLISHAHITVQPKRMVKLGDIRGQPIRNRNDASYDYL